MSAAAALRQARAAGVDIVPEGENLVLTAPAPPPASVVTALARHKADVLALLRPGTCGWSAEDWHACSRSGRWKPGCRGKKPRLAPSPAALPNGSTGSWCNRRQAGASAAVGANIPTTSCCRSARNKLAKPGCIRAAGTIGTRAGRPWRSPPFQVSESRHEDIVMTAKKPTANAPTISSGPG